MKEKGLAEIIADILKDSSIVNPVQSRRMDLLKEKRSNPSHSYFLIRLEEKFNLIVYENMTGDAFLTHIFLEEADVTKQKIATDILTRTPRSTLKLSEHR